MFYIQILFHSVTASQLYHRIVFTVEVILVKF